MDEATKSPPGGTAAELPSKHLPPLTYRECPEHKPLRKILGPGVVLAASGIGSGEYVLWPYIAQQVGLSLLIAALFGAIIMFFIATECIRYTLLTGETIITGFTRLWKPWSIGFILLALIPNIWPGYATGVGTIMTFIFGGGDVVFITISSLVAIVGSLVLAPVIYQSMERLLSVMMVIMTVFIVCAVVVVIVIQPTAWTEVVTGLDGIGAASQGVPFAALAGAVAFAGAGGTGVLMASNYVREKNMGMGAYIPRIVSPLTGKEEPGSTIGNFFPQDEENLRRWRGWWRTSNWEQFLTFFLLTILSIVIMSVLAYATVFGQDVGEGFDFIRAEGEALRDAVGSWFMYFFWISGALALFSTNVAVWDMIGRISADGFKATWARDSAFWTESKIYAAALVSLLGFSVIVLASGLQAPLVLLVITSVLSGGTSFVYCILIIQLNRFALPRTVRMGNARFVVMSVAVVFYLFFFVFTVFDLLR